jgi:hypothetical protein
MGFLSSLFGSKSSTPATTTQITTSKLPPEIAPQVEEIAKEAKRLYDERIAEGYVPFEGATIAPFTPDELSAQEGIRGLVGTAAPLQQEALGITRQGSERFTGDVAQEYMNPYQQAVIDIEKREAQEDFEGRILPAFEAQAVGAGGMSGLGSRAGVQAALLGESQARRLGDIQAKGLRDAYTKAQQDFTAQKIRERQQAQDLERLGPAMFASGIAEQGALQQIGEQRRDLAQESLDEAYFRFLEERSEPQAALAQYSGTVFANPLTGMPTTSQTGTQRAAAPSTGSQLLGLGLQAANIYGMGGGFNPGGFSMGNLFKTSAEGGKVEEGLSGIVYRQAAGAVGVPDMGLGPVREEEAEKITEQLDAALAREDAAQVRADTQSDPAVNMLTGLNSFQSPLFTRDMRNAAAAIGGTGVMSPEKLQQIRDTGLQTIRNQMRTGQRERKDMLASQRLFQDTSAAAEFADMEDLVRGPKGYSGSLGQSLITNAIRQLANPNISIASALADPTGVEKYKASQDKINSAVVDLRKTRNARNRAMRAGRSKEDLAAFDKSIADKLAIIKQEAVTAEDVGKQEAIYQEAILNRADKISVIVKRFADATAADLAARKDKSLKPQDLNKYLDDIRDKVLLASEYRWDAASETYKSGNEALTGERLASVIDAVDTAQRQWFDMLQDTDNVEDALKAFVGLNVQSALDSSRAYHLSKTSKDFQILGAVPRNDWNGIVVDLRKEPNAEQRRRVIGGVLKEYDPDYATNTAQKIKDAEKWFNNIFQFGQTK